MALSFEPSLDLLFSLKIKSASLMFINSHCSSKLRLYWHPDFPMPSIVTNLLGIFLPGSIAVKLAYHLSHQNMIILVFSKLKGSPIFVDEMPSC